MDRGQCYTLDALNQKYNELHDRTGIGPPGWGGARGGEWGGGRVWKGD